MNFENKQTHQTVFGGVVTISFTIGISVFFLQSMLASDKFYQKDTISTFIKISGWDDPPPSQMCHNGTDSQMSFELYVNDPDYDNDDNPYGKFIFHQFTNMKDPNDTRGS